MDSICLATGGKKTSCQKITPLQTTTWVYRSILTASLNGSKGPRLEAFVKTGIHTNQPNGKTRQQYGGSFQVENGVSGAGNHLTGAG